MPEREGLLRERPIEAPPASAGPIRTSELLKANTRLHDILVSRLRSRIELSDRFTRERLSDWDRVDEHMHMFIDLRRNRRRSDETVHPTEKEMPFDSGVVVPLSYAVLQVRLTALMAIFLAREPLIQLKGSGPEDIFAAERLEALLAHDLRQMQSPLIMYAAMQDSEKYGIGTIADQWDQNWGHKVNRGIEQFMGSNPIFRSAMIELGLNPQDFEQREWGLISEGNKWRVVDPRALIIDPRVESHDVQNMEFIGDTVAKSRMFLIERSIENNGPYFNLDVLARTGGGQGDTRGSFDRVFGEEHPFKLRASSAELDRDVFDIAQIQVKLVPNEWGLGSSKLPEIWWFGLANKRVIVRAHRSPYDHNQFGYATLQSNIDVHNNNNPGTMTNLISIQNLANWLYSSHVENVKRFLNDAFVYVPKFFELSDILEPGPARHIRLNELGEQFIEHGGQIGSLIHQLPMQDLTQQHLSEMDKLFDLANRMTGVNDPAMGIPTKSKRTLGEINNVLQTSSRRISLTAQLYDCTGLTPLSYRAIANRQQFTTREQYVELLGEAARREGTDRLLINRSMIQGNFNYIPITGITPPEPSRFGQVWLEFLQIAAQIPGAEQIVNFQAIIKQFIEKQGIRNIEEFLVNPTQNILDPEEISQQVQQGNIIPNPQEQPRLASVA